MLLETYFKRLYPLVWDGLYYPSRQNYGILVLRILSAAGSTTCIYKKGKRYTSEDVPLERKLYDGSRTMSPELKDSFSPFNVDGLTAFFSENIKDAQLNSLAAAFGIPPTLDLSKQPLCSALSFQLKAFVDSSDEEADDIVALEYQKMLSASQPEDKKEYRPTTALYKDDQVYLRTTYKPTYDVKLYEKFTHTWSFENMGTQTWRMRRLYFSNHDTARPRAKTPYIDIPETPPLKGVVLSVEMDARGFEERTECRWIMVDSENNDCFPNSGYFSFFVNARYEYE